MKNATVSVPGQLVRLSVGTNPPSNTTTFYPTESLRKQISSGPIVKGNHHSPNPWNFNIATRVAGNLVNCTYGKTDGTYTDSWSGCYGVMVTDNLDTWSATDVQVAAAAAYSELVEAIRGSIDLSIDFAQASQTVATPSQMKSIARNFMLAFRRSGFSKARFLKTLMQQTGSAWLLWSYGIKPTMQTIYDLTSALSHRFYGLTVPFEGSSAVRNRNVINVPNWPKTGWSSKATVTSSSRVKYKVRLAIPDSTITALSQLTSLNPASIAWELMPWSFVIDWFINIGDYLRGLETAVLYGKYFCDGFKTVSNYDFVDQKAVRDGIPPAGIKWSGNYSATGEWKSSSRVILTEFPSPPVPVFQSHLGSGRLLNAAALLTTFLKR